MSVEMSAKSVSPINIFRPWQLESSEADIKLESKVESSFPTSDAKWNIDSPSTSQVGVTESTSLLTRVKGESPPPSPNASEREETNIVHERNISLSEAQVSSSTSCDEQLKVDSSSSKRHQRRGQKRKLDEVKEEMSKYPRFEVLKQPTSNQPTSQCPGMPSKIFHGFPPPNLALSSSPMFPPGSQMGPFIPLLEPPILVPASEVERVCARRPRPKRFSCSECGAAFSNRGQLSGHCRIHTGERPFQCSQPGCEKRFTRNEELTRHRRIHSGLRPFACGVCPKRFGRKDHLKKHLRTHTRHILPQIPNLPHYEHLQHLQQVQHLQHLHHLQQIQQMHLQIPFMSITNNGSSL